MVSPRWSSSNTSSFVVMVTDRSLRPVSMWFFVPLVRRVCATGVEHPFLAIRMIFVPPISRACVCEKHPFLAIRHIWHMWLASNRHSVGKMVSITPGYFTFLGSFSSGTCFRLGRPGSTGHLYFSKLSKRIIERAASSWRLAIDSCDSQLRYRTS